MCWLYLLIMKPVRSSLSDELSDVHAALVIVNLHTSVIRVGQLEHMFETFICGLVDHDQVYVKCEQCAYQQQHLE